MIELKCLCLFRFIFQCYPFKALCDARRDCVGGEDEEFCTSGAYIHEVLKGYFRFLANTRNPPFIIQTHEQGYFSAQPLNNTHSVRGSIQCPQTHFQCPGLELCLPVHLRCNGMFDCPEHEDEVACDSYTCPGFYRCRTSKVCVHPDYVCDGVHHCPQFDDELFCNVTCPDACLCYGLAFSCSEVFPAHDYPQIRFLSARGSEMTTHHLANNTMLIHLSLAKCNLVNMPDVYFPNLHSLDLSDNDISIAHSSQLSHLPRLRVLFLSNNPITSVFLPDAFSISSTVSSNLPSANHSTVTTQFSVNEYHISSAFSDSAHPVFTSPSSNKVESSHYFPRVRRLDLSLVKIPELNVDVFKQFPNLQNLNLSGSGVERVSGEGSHTLTKLRVLDMRGCPISVLPRRLFRGLDQLQAVYADNYKLCCPAVLPDGFNLNNCQAPFDEVSSCETLLRSDVYRVFLSVVASLTLTGNLSSFIFRLLASQRGKSGFHIFTVHLCIADFVMGLYLAIIGVADRLYLGTYLWEDTTWRHSVACKVAGFLSLLSSEASVFIICLITLDRFLVLRFPFSALRFQRSSAHLACAVTWSVSFLLAAVPLFPRTSFEQFYTSTGICIPLPITRREFDGDDYAFGIMIVFNFALFLMIAVGQAVIYQTVQANSMATTFTSRQSQDSNIARRLITVAMTDFLCWFPIGLLGLLASLGIPISGEVNVGMAIFVLPLNSVINPFLYTINIIMEKRQKSKEDRVLKWLESSSFS